MKTFNLFYLFIILIASCGSPKPSHIAKIKMSTFEKSVPSPIKADLGPSFPQAWAAYASINYRGTGLDVFWLYDDHSVKSWVAQKGEWISLQGSAQKLALTRALRTDIRVLNAAPSEKSMIIFCGEIIELVRGGGGRLLMPSFGEIINKIHRIEQGLHIVPEDNTYLIIREQCKPIKCLSSANGKTIVFRHLNMDGGVDEWQITIDKKSVKEVFARTILKGISLKRWIPTG